MMTYDTDEVTAMYQALTKCIGHFEDAGAWIIDRENDGSEEHPIQMSYLSYSRTITKFISEMDAFMVYNYQEVLKRNSLQWGMEMGNADVSGFDAEDVLALLTGAIRAERFCDGAFASFARSGAFCFHFASISPDKSIPLMSKPRFQNGTKNRPLPH